MASIATSLPRSRTRRPRYRPVAGRSHFPEIYFVKRIDNSRLRREVDRDKRRECYRMLGLGVVIFLFGLLFAWQHFRCIRFGYQIEQLKTQREALEEWNRHLRLQQASLADPQRIDTLARRELGLSAPEPRQIVPLDGNPVKGSSGGPPEFARNFSTLGQRPSREP